MKNDITIIERGAATTPLRKYFLLILLTMMTFSQNYHTFFGEKKSNDPF